MAIHWKQIKGLADNSSLLYTFLVFQTDTSPKVYIGTNGSSASGAGNVDLGYLATTYRENTFTQKNIFTYVGGSATYKFEVYGYSMFYRGLEIGYDGGTEHKGAYTIRYDSSNQQYYHNFWVNSGWHNFEINNASYFRIGTDDSYFWTNVEIGTSSATKTLKVTGSCSADYFNATSDMRAKDHIKPLKFNALDFISSLNLYSFHYKHDDSPSIGIIAQEVKDVKIDDFSLVNNIEATGKDNDFMSIKESKLVYILLKAVKELQAEVDELKSRLGE